MLNNQIGHDYSQFAPLTWVVLENIKLCIINP